MFSDRAKIHVAGGKGGNGCVSFRREKHVPKGGPDGGDGGDGGSVWLKGDSQLRDLSPFVRTVHFKADSGTHGSGSHKHGATGRDVEVPVPLGTQAYDSASGEFIADITRPEGRVLVASGGSGGRGNARFVSATRQAPKFAELGDRGEERWLTLTLRLVADVGLAGLPNAGKSSFLRRISNAKPKVADYPFTTIEPMLGVVEIPDEDRRYTVADVPGLLEGAAEGVGLGTDFLSHLERCRMLLHVVDGTGYYGNDPIDNFRVILEELAQSVGRLATKPQIVVLNKADVVPQEELAAARREIAREVEGLRSQGHPAFSWEIEREAPSLEHLVWPVSAVTGEGIAPLLRWVGDVLYRQEAEEAAAKDSGPAEDEERVVYRPAAEDDERVEVLREGEGFAVRGEKVERLVRRTDLDNDEAVRYLGHRLERMGVMEALRDKGASPGDEVRIDEYVFEYQ